MIDVRYSISVENMFTAVAPQQAKAGLKRS
jgi:hypothetical protein